MRTKQDSDQNKKKLVKPYGVRLFELSRKAGAASFLTLSHEIFHLDLSKSQLDTMGAAPNRRAIRKISTFL